MERIDITTFNAQLESKYEYILDNVFFPSTFNDEDKQRFAYSIALSQYNVITTDLENGGLNVKID